ncbi:alkaline phosphatase D family protein [Falsiroseomonas sp.]|uniref:alkaline phosphatase D family protein n=1 Tax=Falsiroseomonas sp. TaxID=2870721 RepID=UPI003F72367E
MASVRRHLAELSRRGLLRGATGLAGLAALGPEFGRRALAQAAWHENPFALGVAAGDPSPDGFVIWTRLAPRPLEPGGGMPPAGVEVGWQVAEDPGFGRTVAQGQAMARPELAHSVHVELEGLRPQRPYFYRFLLGGQASPTGQARTAPAPQAEAALRLVTAGCQHYEHGLFTAWRHIAQEEVDLVFHYGDFIYEYSARPVGAVSGGRSIIRSHAGGETLSLAEYRARYAQYRQDPDLAAASAAHAFAVTFDDHEVANNWTGSIGGRGETGLEFDLRKAAAFQAWYEHMPVRRTALPDGPRITAHRRLAYGRHVALHLLDTRGARDDQPCGDGTKPPCAEVFRPDSQVLGPAQEAWLLDGAARSGATWQVLAQQVPMFARVGPNGSIGMDKWDGYPAARARLLHGLRDRGVVNTVVLSGDVHSAYAATVAAEPEGPALATEFTATSISSDGDGSEQRRGTAALLAANPHIAFHNNRRGYALSHFGADRCTAVFRAVPFVSSPGAPVEDRGRFVVEAGATVLHSA